MRRTYYAMQALVVFAIIVNIALTDLVSHQQVTWRDLPNLFVCLVMGYLLWSNARAQKAREAMITEARAKRQAMMDELNPRLDNPDRGRDS